MKILNLYCGIGGNRKSWGKDHDITAVEINPEIGLHIIKTVCNENYVDNSEQLTIFDDMKSETI